MRVVKFSRWSSPIRHSRRLGKKIGDVQSESLRQTLHAVDRDVALKALDRANVGPVQAGKASHFLLGQAPCRPLKPEDRKFKRTFLLPKALRQGSRSPTEPVLGSFCRRLKADRSAEVRLSKGLPWGFPLQSAAKPRPCKAQTQPISAAPASGPRETCWLEGLRPLAAATDGLARVAAPWPADPGA